MGPWGVFFEGFLRNPVMVGSIIPSSRFTIAKMLAPVRWDECKLFVEYGPGVGTFCRPVLDRLRRDGQLIVIDTNPLYIDYLRATITRQPLYCGAGFGDRCRGYRRSPRP